MHYILEVKSKYVGEGDDYLVSYYPEPINCYQTSGGECKYLECRIDAGMIIGTVPTAFNEEELSQMSLDFLSMFEVRPAPEYEKKNMIVEII